MPGICLTQGLRGASGRYPDRLATICAGRRRCYAELAVRVARLAAGLRQLGLRPGDRVAVLALDSDRYLELYFAAWWAGGVVAPLDVRWHAREIAHALDDCRARLLVVDDAHMAAVAALSQRSQWLHTVLHCGEGQPDSGMFSYEQLIADHTPLADTLRADGDPAAIFHSGGNAGLKNGMTLSHAELWSRATAEPDSFAFEGAAPPMFQLAGCVLLLALVLRGSTQVIA